MKKNWLALLLVAGLAASAVAQTWTSTVGDLSLTINRAEMPAGSGIWHWTYALVQDPAYTPPTGGGYTFGSISFFTAAFPLLDYGGTAGGFIYSYGASYEVSNPPDPLVAEFGMEELTWTPVAGTNNSFGLWTWVPSPDAGKMGTLRFEFFTRYQEIGTGIYEAYTYSYGANPNIPYRDNVHTFEEDQFGGLLPMPIPEPASTVMLLMAVSGGLLIRRRR
jgi:hypothetical protein